MCEANTLAQCREPNGTEPLRAWPGPHTPLADGNEHRAMAMRGVRS